MYYSDPFTLLQALPSTRPSRQFAAHCSSDKPTVSAAWTEVILYCGECVGNKVARPKVARGVLSLEDCKAVVVLHAMIELP
ncbi:hypothetical protein BAUCODRAFT_32009 [Baudoinia panamericana UAMH 10762]|uniref:Uncharacterized protein n=1 Tax=Baudoinia panamericana (strain UAMH 10762) TaxID=717646 RepID=M2NFK2_BAUPA|nr:uncharacterized protein BAUCODRAFT_32009 [Baudoinia panamericana UAMH 10762]EMC98004.1 hypothetical protein BAUCODRAFT_32009 [Baudoinia panamericana UAMH 10762]